MKYKNKDGFISSIILFLILIISLLQIFLRSVLNIPLIGVEELSRYFFISLIFLGLPYAFRLDGHIKLEGIQKYFPPKVGRVMELLKHISGILVFSTISISAVYTVSTNFESKTPTISLPFWLFFMPTIIGFILLTIEHVKALIKSFKMER